MLEIAMPSLGADMEYATLVRWHVRPGDVIRIGDVVAEVETQKGVFSVDAREGGIVDVLIAAEGERVPVGAPIVRLRAAAPEPPIAPPAETAGPAEAPCPSMRVSPLARRVASDLGVDLTKVHGTGDAGAITRADVARAAAEQGVSQGPPRVETPPPPPSAAPRLEVHAAMRAAIGAAMARSKREIPHYYVQRDVDMTDALAWLQTANATRDVTNRLLPSAIVLKATAQALRTHGAFNGIYRDGAYQPSRAVHLGVAIALRGGGLIAPAILNAETLTLDALMHAMRDLVTRARGGGLRASELSDATVTVTHLGESGVGSVFGVIYPPQVAIIGFGDIVERPWVAEGMLGVRPIVTVTLAADHRVSDGREGAALLADIARLLGRPDEL